MTWTPRRKRWPWDELLTRRDQWRASGQVVVWTNGSFDLLHPGHVASLEAARGFGDVLIVGINSDESVRGYKGPTRPILNESERAAMVSALECVDAVLIFPEATPEVALARLRPDVHVKGAEYAPPHGRPVPERALVESYGGRVEYVALVPGVSTTDLIGRVAGFLAPSLLLGGEG